MTPIEIIVSSLSIAFCWVNYINPFAGRPFSCIKCMTGWVGFAMGCLVYGWVGLLFLPAGVFAGAMFEAVAMRYL